LHESWPPGRGLRGDISPAALAFGLRVLADHNSRAGAGAPPRV